MDAEKGPVREVRTPYQLNQRTYVHQSVIIIGY